MIDSVPMKYSYKTRIGNWSEEWELEETKLKDYKKMQETGNIQLLEADKKKALSECRASLSFLGDKNLKNGSTVMMHNLFNSHNLTCNIWERIPCLGEFYGSNCTPIPNPMARSVMRLEKVPDASNTNSHDICYGDKIYIKANSRLFGKDRTFYLMSQPTSTLSFAKISHFQEVSFTNKPNFMSVWELEHVDAKIRFEMVGQPVRSEEELLIKHVHSSSWLGSEKGDLQNIYGKEKEVFVKSFLNCSKSQNLIAERVGRTTGDTPLRGQDKQNSWVLLSGMRPQDQFDEDEIEKPIKAEDILVGLVGFVRNKGAYGLRGLRQMFRKIDANDNGVLEFDDLKWGLKNYGINLMDDEVRLLIKAYDKNGNGQLEYVEFISALNDLVTPKRKECIMGFYQKMKDLLGGSVTLEGLAKVFDARRHPDVHAGEKHEEEVFTEYIKNWGNLSPFVEIGEDLWLSYYADLSGCIVRDDHFERHILCPFNLR